MKHEGDKLSNISNEKSEYSRVCGSLITQYITSKYDLEQVILISEPQFSHPLIWEEKSYQRVSVRIKKLFQNVLIKLLQCLFQMRPQMWKHLERCYVLKKYSVGFIEED